ncbi:uncharacterized protein LOC133176879 [Saccostrea echinata]|uniref:uncharacterized protein LOC133176879 n=1 Tax=Saccostrea echinata TaxID=191078 RepID=UPI002A81B302|nr:uncharacterized protein LOC133176879 [Saccostrea echinata]
MNTLVVFSVLVASCFAGYDKKVIGPGLVKYGTCPYYPDLGAVGRQCSNDYQCPRQQKCCFVFGGWRRCQVPIEFQRNGRCPTYTNSFGSYCNTDRDCYYGQKCCTGPYGNVNTCKNVYYAFNTLGGNFPYSGGNVVGSFPLPAYSGNVVGPYSPFFYGTGVGSGPVGSGLYGPGVASGPYGPGVVGGPYVAPATPIKKIY